MNPNDFVPIEPEVTPRGVASAAARGIAPVPAELVGGLATLAKWGPGLPYELWNRGADLIGSSSNIPNPFDSLQQNMTAGAESMKSRFAEPDTPTERTVERGFNIGGHGLAALAMPAASGFSRAHRMARATPMVAGAAASGQAAEELGAPVPVQLAAEGAGAFATSKMIPKAAQLARGAAGLFTEGGRRGLSPLQHQVRTATNAFRKRAEDAKSTYGALKPDTMLPTKNIKARAAAAFEELAESEKTGSVKRQFKWIMDLPEEVSLKKLRAQQRGLNRTIFPKNVKGVRTKPPKDVRALDDMRKSINSGLDDLAEEMAAVGGDAATQATKIREAGREWATLEADKDAFRLVERVARRFTRNNKVVSQPEYEKFVASEADELVRRFGQEHVDNLDKIAPYINELPPSIVDDIGREAKGSREVLSGYASEGLAAYVRAIGGMLYKARLLRRGMKEVKQTANAVRSSLAGTLAIVDPEIAAKIAAQIDELHSGLRAGTVMPAVSGFSRSRSEEPLNPEDFVLQETP